MFGWLDQHVRHIAVAVGCVACTLVGMAIGLSVGGHSVLRVLLYHDAPRTVTKTLHGSTRTVTRPGKARAVEAAPHTITVTVTAATTVTRTQPPMPPSTVTSTITATETTPPTTTTETTAEP